jgi:zinc/manganese transport system substrate-binding protein
MRRSLAVLAVMTAIPAARADPLPVVAGFSVLADITRSVGGDLVRVDSLVGPDGDAHDYQPTPADARAVAAARVVVANGLGLDPWLERLERAAGFQGIHIVAASEVRPLLTGGTADPHAWQDVAGAERYAQAIEAGLERADPPHQERYRQNLAEYEAVLADLDRWVRDRIASVPDAKRRVITTHDAFGYFGRAYGVAFRAPVGMSEDSEPSAAAVAQLIRQIRGEGTRALFVENMTDPRLLDQLAAEAGVAPAGTLFADALSKPGEGGETYPEMMRHNVTLLVAAMARNPDVL